MNHYDAVKNPTNGHITPFREFGISSIIAPLAPCVIALFLIFLMPSGLVAQKSSPPPKEKVWNVGLSEQGGMLVTTVGGLYFSQYYNSLDIEADFRIVRPLWIGVSSGYAATLPSKISEATPLILPAWDSFHTDLHLNLRTDNGWLFRTGLDAWYAKIANIQLYMFFTGVNIDIAKQFKLGPVIIEPGIVSTWQFRRDTSTYPWIIAGRVRILF